jgi:hypothetical protein
MDFGERLVVDQGGAGAGRSDMARMSWPRRNKRSVVRTMSSCSGVPTRWAIKPMRTAGCAVKRSCSGERTKMPVLAMEPTGCVIETSLSAVGGREALRQYPGWRARQAWLRARCTGPRGSSPGSRVWRASGLGSRLCWLLCTKAANSSPGGADYVDRGRIAFGSTYTCGGVPGPYVPPPAKGTSLAKVVASPVSMCAQSEPQSSPFE